MHSDSLSEALVKFFYATTVSSAIVESLTGVQSSLDVAEILANVRDIRRMELPQTAIESSLYILGEAGIVVHSAEDTYALSEVGKVLAQRLAVLRKPLD
ncbi:hypothetical protein JXM67_00055 [candidate division WOR-3 bacterium]|nr:hypothetical protein [candidate division WOR-3 bacterium]